MFAWSDACTLAGRAGERELKCRPLSKEEVANGVQQVITCNERAREVVVSQNVGSKQLGRSFHFDKVKLAQRISAAPFLPAGHAWAH
jgi:hypothetical protein